MGGHGVWLLPLVLLFLSACTAGETSVPTLPPAPVMVIVTLTPGPPPATVFVPATTYVVEPGDTLSGIGSRFGVSEEALMTANGISNRDQLVAGQRLAIPASSR